MAPQASGFSPLRVVTQRLSSTPAKHMARVAPCLAASILDCKEILSSSTSHGVGKEASEASVVVHKFKSQLSALLQEKAVEARWSAVVLIKATIQAGGWEFLRGCGSWVRGLLGLLGRPDPVTTKKLCIITITKIFLLTHDYQTLVREITTPHLPSLINICLTIVSPKSPSAKGHQAFARTELLPTILDAFCHLLPRHPTLFRPFTTQIQASLLPLLAPTPSSLLPLHESHILTPGPSPVSAELLDTAQRLFALLHCCAPKNTAGEEWRKAMRTIIANIHHTADKTFRAVIEDWEATPGSTYQASETRDLGDQIRDMNEDLLGLPSWQGISAGGERLCGILTLLKAFLITPTSSTIVLPLGPLMDMFTRLFSLVVPSRQASAERYEGSRLNPEIGRDEREELWAALPNIHVVALDLLAALTVRLDYSFTPLAQGALDQITWIFATEKFNSNIRTTIYTLVAKLLRFIGPSLTRSSVSGLTGIIKSCCDDLFPSSAATVTAVVGSTSKDNEQTKGASSINADAFLTSSATKAESELPSRSTYRAALILLPLFITYLAPQSLPYPLRVQIDRTAVLTKHKQAMIASILNPALNRKGTRSNKSIMPLLVRSFGTDSEVEGLLRPRMPILQVGRDFDGETDSVEGFNEKYIPHTMELEHNYAGNPAEIEEYNNPPNVPTFAEPLVRHSEFTTINRETSTATPATVEATNVTDDTAPPAQFSEIEFHNGANKRHRESAEADNTPVASGQFMPATVDNKDAPDHKRLRFEVEPTSVSSVPVSDLAVDVTRVQPSYAEEPTHPDVTSRGVPASASSTVPGLGSGSYDSDDDIEIPPLVMDSDTDEGEDQGEGEGF